MGPWLFAILLAIAFSMIAVLAGMNFRGPAWKDETRELVKKDIKPEDYGRAFRILLDKELSGSRVEGSGFIPVWVLCILGILFLTAFFLSVPAYTAFDIGVGKLKVRRQKSYDSFLRKILPTFLIMGVLASALGTVLYESFKN